MWSPENQEPYCEGIVFEAFVQGVKQDVLIISWSVRPSLTGFLNGSVGVC